MTEKQLQQAVLDVATMYLWRSYHTYDSRRSTAGFPDLVLVRKGRLIFAELKKEGENPTAKQIDWLDDLKIVSFTATQRNVEVYVWRPSDLDSTIVETLRR